MRHSSRSRRHRAARRLGGAAAAALGAGAISACAPPHHPNGTPGCAATIPTATSGPWSAPATSGPSSAPAASGASSAPAASGPAAPVLTPVWQRTITGLVADGPATPVPVGDAVVRLAGRTLTFYDAAGGAVRATRTVPGGPVEVARAADEHGTAVAALRTTTASTAAGGQTLRVYDTAGALRWRSPHESAALDAARHDAGGAGGSLRYVGGYVADVTRRPHQDPGDLVVRDRDGRAVARARIRAGRRDAADVVAVRPGWLAVAAAGPRGRDLWLLDLTRPARPRWRPLSAPPPRPGDRATDPAALTTGDGHLYVTWSARGATSATTVFARYDVARAGPVWHTRCLPDTASAQVVTDPRGGAAVLALRDDTGIAAAGTRFRLLDPRTGHRLGPAGGWTVPGDAVPGLALRAGVLYVSTGGARTRAVDVRTGRTTRTLTQGLLGATDDGALILLTGEPRSPTVVADRVS